MLTRLSFKKEDFSKELEPVMNTYGLDIHASNLEFQLKLLGDNMTKKATSTQDMKNFLLQLFHAQQQLFNQVLKLIFVMLATNACSERSFSAKCRIKTYLRSTMQQGRLNHLMDIYIHKELTDKLNII